jgi:putative oxidoreductase
MSTQSQRLDETEVDHAPATVPEPARARSTTLGFADEEVVPRRRHVIDRFDNAAGLFLLRLVTAAVMGVHGYQKVQDRTGTLQQVRALHLPAPDTVAMIFGPIEIAIAVALVIGLAVRAAGLGTAIVAIGALVLVRWTSPDTIFVAHQPGFTGETELLLAGIGLLLLGVGGGGWGLDRKVRDRRST